LSSILTGPRRPVLAEFRPYRSTSYVTRRIPGDRARLGDEFFVLVANHVSGEENLVSKRDLQVSGDDPEELSTNNSDEPCPETDLTPEQLDEIYGDSLEAAS